MAANDGPKLEDPAVIAQRMLMGANSVGGGGGGGSGGDKGHFDTVADAFVSHMSRLIGKLTFGLIKVRFRTLGSTSAFAQFTPQQGWADKSVNQGASALGAKGGVLADIATNKINFKMDFSNIAKPAVEGLPVQSMSYGSLGNLTPSDTGGGGGRGGLGL